MFVLEKQISRVLHLAVGVENNQAHVLRRRGGIVTAQHESKTKISLVRNKGADRTENIKTVENNQEVGSTRRK